MHKMIQPNKAFLIFAYLVLVCSIWLLSTYKLPQKLAYEGFTPIQYTNLKQLPENFVNNFPSGVEQYDRSIMMQIYPLANKYLGIETIVLMRYVILLEILALVYLAQFYTRMVLNKKDESLILLITILLLASGIRNISLSNFGTAAYFGQFYTFADVLRVLAIVSFFQRKYIFAFTFFFITMWFHIGLAINALGFCSLGLALYLIYSFFFSLEDKNQKEPIFQNGELLRLIVFYIGILGSITSIYYAYFNNVAFEGAGIPRDAWINLTRIGNFHWYPVDNEYLTKKSSYLLLPFFAFVILIAHYYPKKLGEYDRKLVFGFISAIILTIFGLIVTVIPNTSPTLIKLCLIRTMDLIPLFGVFYVITGVYEDFNKKVKVVDKSLLMSVILLPVLSYHFVFSSLLACIVVRKSILEMLRKKVKELNFRDILILVSMYGTAICFFLDRKGLPTNLTFVLVFIVLFIALSILAHFKKSHFTILALIITITTLAITFISNRTQTFYIKSGEADAYYQAQLWSKVHTPKQSVFIVDPHIWHGWRDVSQRSSFGTPREWLHASWLYDSDAKIFNEGQRRFKIYGLNLEDFYNIRPAFRGFEKLDNDSRAAFYGFSAKDWKKIAKDYGIDYLVMTKEFVKHDLALKKEYENEIFVIYKL